MWLLRNNLKSIYLDDCMRIWLFQIDLEGKGLKWLSLELRLSFALGMIHSFIVGIECLAKKLRWPVLRGNTDQAQHSFCLASISSTELIWSEGCIITWIFSPCLLLFKDYKLDFFLRQLWTDPRLRHDWNETLALGNTMMDKLWVPDTYFENSKSSKFHKVTMVNKLLSISPDGGVHYNAR